MHIPMKYYVYILYSDSFDKYYYGQTQDLRERLKRHNSGREKYTKSYVPWSLYAYKSFSTRGEAVILERKLKNLKSTKRMLDFIIAHNFQGSTKIVKNQRF